MLHELEQVDWDTLEHAYGKASDVPDHLHALRSPSAAERKTARHHLFGSIWHQGTVYSSSAPAATVLIALVADPATPDRAAMLSLLQALATGSGYIEAHESIMGEELADICAEQGTTVEAARARERHDVEAAHAAVSAGLAVYHELLADPDPQVRSYTLYLLASLPEHALVTVPRLRALLLEEGDPAVRVGLAMALHILADDSPQSCALFNALLAESPDPVARLVAAAALATRTQDQTPAQVLELLVEATHRAQTDRSWLNQPDAHTWSVASGYLPSPWETALVDLITAAFMRLRPPLRAQLLARSLARAADPDVAHELAVVFLTDVFEVDASHWGGACWGGGTDDGWQITYWMRGSVPSRDTGTLTNLQRTCIAALLRADAFWRNETNLLELFGLPTKREALRSWVAPAITGRRV